MFTLVIGGSGSGKSAFAERLTCSLPGERIYIATMQPFDEECRMRIKRHRRMRAERAFRTIERYTDVGGLCLPADSSVLLECTSNLTANEIYSPDGHGKDAALAGILALREQCRHLTVVTNEVFTGGDGYDDETLRYMRALALINRELAAAADCVTEVICGCPDVWKGELHAMD